MRAGLRTGTILVVCALSLTAMRAGAEPTPREIRHARSLFADAEKDEDAGRWSDALEKLREAIAIKSTPGLRFHIATCEENLGKLLDAQIDYAAAQEQAKLEQNAEVLDAVGEPLQRVKARIPKLQVVLPSDVSGVVVRVDGRVLSRDEVVAPVRVDPGPHTIEAEAPGRRSFSANVSAAEREVLPVRVLLPSQAATPASIPTPASTPAPAQTRSTAPAAASPRSAPEDRTSKSGRGGAIIATAGAVVLAAGGVGAFLLAGSAQDSARDACAHGDAACDSDRTTVRAWDATALGAWIGGAALGGLAVYLWAKPQGESGRASAKIAPAPGGLRLEGSF